MAYPVTDLAKTDTFHSTVAKTAIIISSYLEHASQTIELKLTFRMQCDTKGGSSLRKDPPPAAWDCPALMIDGVLRTQRSYAMEKAVATPWLVNGEALQ